MDYKVGDQGIYPGYGLGRIVSIDTKEISGLRQRFYCMLMVSSETRIMVPEHRMASVRPIISSEEAKKVLTLLRETPKIGRYMVDGTKNWSKRYQQYMKLLKTGDIFDTARILRELLDIDKSKGLSFYEKNLMLTVCKMLFDELSTVVEESELQKVLDFASILAD